MIDNIDRNILNIIQTNARTSNAEIARRVGLTPSAIFERIKKLERNGVISSYETRINPASLGKELLSFAFVSLRDMKRMAETCDRLVEIPCIQEVHYTAGEDCFLIKIRTRDPNQLREVLEQINSIESVRTTRTTIALTTVKETYVINLD